jgi:hypothetical protein
MTVAELLGSSSKSADWNILLDEWVFGKIVYAFEHVYDDVAVWYLHRVIAPLKNLAVNETHRNILGKCGIIRPLVDKLDGDEVRSYEV